jgi:hypothetical protein
MPPEDIHSKPVNEIPCSPCVCEPEKVRFMEFAYAPEFKANVYRFGDNYYLYKGKHLLPLKGDQGIKIEEDSISSSWG